MFQLIVDENDKPVALLTDLKHRIHNENIYLMSRYEDGTRTYEPIQLGEKKSAEDTTDDTSEEWPPEIDIYLRCLINDTSEQWVPENEETYFFVETDGEVAETYFLNNHPQDTARWKIGNCFKTYEEAKAAAERVRRALKGNQYNTMALQKGQRVRIDTGNEAHITQKWFNGRIGILLKEGSVSFVAIDGGDQIATIDDYEHLTPVSPSIDTLVKGDVVVDKDGDTRKVFAVMDEVFLPSIGHVKASGWFHKEKAKEECWRVVTEDDEHTELTLQQVADKFGVPVEQLRIKDDE
jgi:hypothetical protein